MRFQLLGAFGRGTNMTPQEKAESLGITFTRQEPGYLALVVRTGDLLITSGHVSDLKGKLGAGLTVEQGKAAARQCATKILNSVWDARGTLDGLRVLKLLGCVDSTLEFDGQHLVVDGCSDLLHEVFGETGDGHHARSALGFAPLPTGAAVEVEAIFEIQACPGSAGGRRGPRPPAQATQPRIDRQDRPWAGSAAEGRAADPA